MYENALSDIKSVKLIAHNISYFITFHSLNYRLHREDVDTYCHVPEEEVTPLILDEEEESNDQEEVTNADEDDNYHSRVKRELKL